MCGFPQGGQAGCGDTGPASRIPGTVRLVAYSVPSDPGHSGSPIQITGGPPAVAAMHLGNIGVPYAMAIDATIQNFIYGT
jgi:hypothetical protein